MGMQLTVTVGPFARFRYEGRRPDVVALTGERMTEANAEGAERGVLHVESNRRSVHKKRFNALSEAAIVPLDANARGDALLWFAQEFAADLDAIEKATGSAAEVLYGVITEHM